MEYAPVSSADQSPVVALLDHVVDSIGNIAPERLPEVQLLLDDIKFLIIDQPGLAFEASSVAKEVKIPIAGLEFLWVQSYALWILQKHHGAVGLRASNLAFRDRSDARSLPLLLPWALHNQFQEPSTYVRASWPTDTPRPTSLKWPEQGIPSDERVASEIALCGLAWILHHGLAHIRLQHTNVVPASVLRNEEQADIASTQWILDGAPHGYPMIKRSLGVSVALVSMGILELFSKPQSKRTHPHSASRIHAVLGSPPLSQEPSVLAAAAALLGMYLQQKGVGGIAAEYETSADWLVDCCHALRTAVTW